jgi:LacI family xylobiose transport system transcriptional regulator
VAWFGLANWQGHGFDRLSGALAGLGRAGIELRPDMIVDGWGPGAQERGCELLSRRDRPTAILALWQDSSAALARAARELGLVPGRDFEMVGWAREEDFAETYASRFAPGPVPPAVVWRVTDMAEAAVSRLAERRRNPGLPALRIRVPTALKVSDA